MSLYENIFINVLSGFICIGIVYLFNRSISSLTQYKVVLIKKKQWTAFEKALPEIHSIVTDTKDKGTK